ncbi:HVO_0649 family zinc finger protein [Natronobacterium texcoconense]|nr:HVO_0649 family zinc finger protein [Natronobacterium texcoconense]
MSVHRSPFDRLREKFDSSELECRQCGYHASDGGWRVTTSGNRVQYQFVCPACDAVETREMRLSSGPR